MNFGTKIMIAFTVILALAFGVSGSMLIMVSTNSSLDQSKDAAAGAHRFILYTLSVIRGTAQAAQQDREFDALIDTLTNLDTQSGQNWRALRLTNGGDVVYLSREPGLFKDGLIEKVESERFASLTFQSPDGAYLLQMAGQFVFGNHTMFLESVYDVSAVFSSRQEQHVIFRQLFAVVVALGALLSWLLSFWMTMPLRRLSRVTRTIASGDLSCRAEQRSQDEIGILAADFNNMADQMEKNINEMKDTMLRQEEFMGGLAHELKTPMTSIIGYADLLRGHTLSDADRRDAANYIFMEGRRLEVLSLKLLDLIVLKKRDFTFLPTSIAHIIEDTARLLGPALKKLNIGFTYDCDDSVCMLEPDLFMSLLLNLVDNARKAIDADGRIVIRSRSGDGICSIDIIDNGRGIPAEELGKIKDAFYRVDKSRSRAHGGAGLGLRLCDEIADVHGGKITFESEPGRGTTVSIKLKVKPDD